MGLKYSKLPASKSKRNAIIVRNVKADVMVNWGFKDDPELPNVYHLPEGYSLVRTEDEGRVYMVNDAQDRAKFVYVETHIVRGRKKGTYTLSTVAQYNAELTLE